ncbi:3-hydroxyacyl-CoA dehydrogenase [Modicisalibacter ilicicola DSM 19980]|uniref:3-hydroxyacyl-CoA dehydrogenase n=1 Tax=Modicisalibacter ilicicola DSM 19980 TaxID=1121942 RepID=A0A1M5EJ26_9GAMM|nr:enoyl-CoA hydratase/isomerase family protein [Halomonas ilicicola]SHF79071.1 3-hydroxyacyl-CoA dehydrogenase [Halomonas ilicicola DSM 19980]
MQDNQARRADASSPVSYARHERVGVIRIDNPPVNALGQAVRQGLLDALESARHDHDAEVIVLMAVGRTFIAGADIREFGKPPQAPLLPDVIAALEANDKPVIAVLHGTALGGGLEVALGCHLRIALAGTRVGLPEVKLGLLPGAGGTQRLPRLAGVECALDMITSGRFVDADEAKTRGIVDEVVTGEDPLSAGLTAAEQLLQGHYVPRVSGELPAPATDAAAWEDYRQRLADEVPYLFSPFRIVDAVEATTRLPFAEGLKHERALFMECMDSPQRAGLIHAFFATRGTHKVPGAESDASFTTLGLVGHHPLFDALDSHVTKAGVRLVNLDADTGEDIQACLVAPDVGAFRRQTLRDALPVGAPWVDVGTPHGMSADAGDAILMLSPREADLTTCELVDRADNPALIQALANTLKRLKRQVVVTRQASVIAALEEALSRVIADAPETVRLEAAWHAEGWDLSPWLAKGDVPVEISDAEAERYRQPLDLAWQQVAKAFSEGGQVHRDSDIDVLAIQAFGYPQHLGGPAFRSLASR